MSIRFHLSPWDVIQANRYFARRTPVIWFGFLLLFSSIYHAGSAVIWERSWIIGVILLVFIVLVVWLFVELLTFLFLSLRLAKAKGVTGEHHITLSEEGIREETKYNDTLHRWNIVKKVKQNKSYIFILLYGGLVHVIPKKSFHSMEEMNSFFQQAVKYWESSK